LLGVDSYAALVHANGRQMPLAGFHAAQALISERTGRAVKTHRGVAAELHRFDDQAPVQVGRDAHDELAGVGFGRQRLRDGFAVRTHVPGHVLDQVPDAGHRLPGFGGQVLQAWELGAGAEPLGVLFGPEYPIDVWNMLTHRASPALCPALR
jgi:hypothetical protein